MSIKSITKSFANIFTNYKQTVISKIINGFIEEEIGTVLLSKQS